jgi:phosphatidylserine/phosphatidylglycerophosphate/cardiolipin synthase-like enzyme
VWERPEPWEVHDPDPLVDARVRENLAAQLADPAPGFRREQCARRPTRIAKMIDTLDRILPRWCSGVKRAVKIQFILEKNQRTEKYSSATFICHAGIPTFIDAQHSIAHNKIMVIDGATVITGSFNFTKAAEDHNAENLLIIRDKERAAKYSLNCNQHKAHPTPYEFHGKADAAK